MGMNYKIETKAFENGIIEQYLYQDVVDNEMDILTRWMVNTREEGIKKALIDLGWTPPDIEDICDQAINDIEETGKSGNPFCDACKERCTVDINRNCAMIMVYLSAKNDT